MPFANALPLWTGNVQGFPDAYQDQVVHDFDGTALKLLYGIAKLTDTLQTAIPLFVPSFRLQSNYPDKLLVIGNGDQVNYVGIRLPPTQGGEELLFGELPKGCTLIGTTGENLKVSPTTGTTHTVTSPVITAASNAYTPDAQAIAFRSAGVADAASPSLLRTFGADTPLQITVSNAGNTAVGTGIRLSQAGAVAHILVAIYLGQAIDMPRLREITQKSADGQV